MTKTVFMFDGQGAFRSGVGKELYGKYPKAKAVIDHGSDVLGYDLTEYLWGGGSGETSSRTSIAQPAISIVSLAYAEVLHDIGLDGAVSLGHSLGEATAIVYCNILRFDDGVRMIRKRGEVMEEGGAKGTMMAVVKVGQPELETICGEVTAEIKEPVVIANVNAPGQIVVSGHPDAVKSVAQRVAGIGGRAIPLNVGGAWHSPYLEGAAQEFARFIDGLEFRKPVRPFYSVVLQKQEDDPAVIKKSLRDQMLAQVNWVQAVTNLQQIGHGTFLEIGPSRILMDLVGRIDGKIAVDSVALHGDLHDLVRGFESEER